MGAQRRYGAVFGFLVVTLLIGVAYAFTSLSIRKSRDLGRGEASDTFTVTNPELIRPSADAYRRFRSEDSTWRAMYARPVSLARMLALSLPPKPWVPSPYQQMRDRVFQLTSDGNLAQAAALLESWLESNPQDLAETIDLARLYAQMGKTENAIRWYRRALSIENTLSVRAELADLLLNTGSYALAEGEYRLLLTRDPRNLAFRLGLARSLAWGDKPRAAERELVAIMKQFPADTATASLLASVRDAFEPGSEEALVWIAERPKYLPYRIALARAYAREKKFAKAYAQYDTILAAKPTVAMLVEAAGVHAAARDSIGNAFLLGRAVAMAPSDTGYRYAYAKALTWSGDWHAAIEQYTLLIGQAPTADFYYGRGQLYVWTAQYPRALVDLDKSVALKPTYEAYVLAGDVNRWNGNYRRARSDYLHALALKPNDVLVLAALNDVKRLENMVYAATPGVDEVGWISNNSYIEDNSGFLFLSAGLSRGFRMSGQWLGSITFDQRRISQRSPRGPERYLSGYTIGGSSTYYFGRLAVSANAGVAKHSLVPVTGYGGASAQLVTSKGTASFGVSNGPVYSALMSTQALLRFSQNGTSMSTRPMRGTTIHAGVRIPAGSAELSVDGEQLYLSDGNRRTAISAGVRVPVTKRISAIYVGSSMGYAERSDLYWDPTRYTSHSVGVEYAVRKPMGLSLAVRALPGIARSSESLRLAQDSLAVNFAPRNVSQLSLSGDLEYRRNRWALQMSSGYGRGREGGYQSLNGSLRLRVDW